MHLRLTLLGLGIVGLSILTSAVPANAQSSPINPGPGAATTRDGAIAMAADYNYADTSQAGGGRGTEGPISPYSCDWYYQRAIDPDERPVGAGELGQIYEDLDLNADAGETIEVRVRCTHNETGLEPEWSPSTQEWSPGVTEVVPTPDPLELAMDAMDEIVLPVPNGTTSPPLSSGTYAQLPTTFDINDWAPLTAAAEAGEVTSTVTATPVEVEWIVVDDDQWGQTELLGNADCVVAGAFESAGCVWVPPHSSAGQDSISPDTGEPCFDLAILVRWEFTWEYTGPDGSGGPEPLGPPGGIYMSSSTCLVVAEVQAVVDHG